MKLFNVLLVVALLILAGGFTYFAVIDVPVEQKPVTEMISNDRLGL